MSKHTIVTGTVMSTASQRNAPTRVVTLPRGADWDDADAVGLLVEIPTSHARPGKVIRSRTVVVRPAWPHEYNLPLGSEVPAGL